MSLLDRIFQNIEENKVTEVVFLDLKKVFDTVDHTVLINKLHKYNLKSTAWFSDYLTNRQQKMNHRGIKSSSAVMICGVPQGFHSVTFDV